MVISPRGDLGLLAALLVEMEPSYVLEIVPIPLHSTAGKNVWELGMRLKTVLIDHVQVNSVRVLVLFS